ncbi:MAG TPA: cadmium-translocating P-type ATPase [Nitrospirae bacterium]|nr:cadmium-translocating P-type ATPase [Nitrospirota bacterium]
MNNDSCREESACSCGGGNAEEKSPLWMRQQLTAGGIAAALLISGLMLEFFTALNIPAQIVFMSVIAVSGRDILKKAGRSILKRRLDINCLIGIAAFGSFFIGHGEEGAAVVFLFFVAETLEEYAADKAKKSISQLLKLAPETAKVKRGGKEIELHVHEIIIGDITVIRPGEKIPLDGKVLTGHSSINESPITGESLPVEKEVGDEVYAGTMNEEGYLEVSVTRKSEDTVLSRIVKLVEEAERKKSETEKFIDKFARYYTPVVIILAFGAFLVPTFILGYSWEIWFYRSLVLLVISCPCALAISTPVAMVSALTSSARHGVLIKGASYLEELSKVKVIAFDKTGTLTKGKLEVTDIIGFNGHSSEEVLSMTATLESRSEHPIAKAILKKAGAENIHLKEISRFRAVKGRGLEALIGGQKYYAGARSLFNGLSMEIPGEISQLESEGKTVVFVANENMAIGAIALGDVLREKAPKVISDLKKLHIKTAMITGDNKKVAGSLAGKVGIDEYHAELLPEDKVKVVEKLVKKFGSVAMVGDGVNDAPALAVANVGIAMGAIGTDVAIETADIALMHDDLSKIDYLMYLSRKTMRVVKQNVSLSILIKGSLTILALLGLINLWVAVAVGDMGLSLAVILNSMRLTRVKARSL